MIEEAGPAVEAHRLLGDGRTMALVRDDATIDWWCAPRPHDDPLLWSLLDAEGGTATFVGAGPVGDRRDRSRRRDHEPIAGPVLRTLVASTAGDPFEVVDALLPAAAGGSALVRVVHRREGPTLVRHRVRLGGFGSSDANWSGGAVEIGGRAWVLHTIGGTTTVRGHDAVSDFEAGDTEVALVLTADHTFDVRLARLLAEIDEQEAAEQSRRPSIWSSGTWAKRNDDGLAVMRACTYSSTGAVVAAPTTSLPEAVGADRQFDYRYTWLRDGSLAAAIAAVVGESRAAADYLGFLEALGPARLLEAPVWTVEGTPVPSERVVDDVTGWAGSVPVRVGNEAREQLQFDALGFVAEAVDIFVREGGELTDQRWALVETVAHRAATGPREPTSGIWEMRRPRWFVAAEIGRWMALDHAWRLGRLAGRPLPPHWRSVHHEIRRRVRHAVQPDGLLPQMEPDAGTGPAQADASALLAIICGLIDRDDPAASAVIDACLRHLGTGPYVYRYPPDSTDGFTGREGAFVPASFWVVTALATVGRLEEAQARLEALDAALPRLLAEEVAIPSGAGRGNTPLVWAHMELLRAYHALTTASR